MDLQTWRAELAERPRLRGWLHFVATFAAIVGLVVLVHNAADTQARIGAWVYGVTSIALYATSSSYHIFARTPRFRAVMQRADHTMIYILIAGSFTPVALLTMHGTTMQIALVIMWSGAALGVLAKMAWFSRASRFGAALYIVLGWAGLMAFPSLWSHPWAFVLIVAGGLLYTVGALLFALHRPRWSGRWFGYHELWHTFGVGAGVLIFFANLILVQTA